MKDYDNDEDDGYDETIYPVDFAIYGQIVDDVTRSNNVYIQNTIVTLLSMDL